MAVSGRRDKPAATLSDRRHGDVKGRPHHRNRAVSIDFMKNAGVASAFVAAPRDDSPRKIQMNKVSLALAAVLALASFAAGCATPPAEKPAPVIRKG